MSTTNLNKDERIEKIINLILQYNVGDYSKRETVSDKGDELDAIIIGLNTLGEEAQDSGRQIKNYEKRVASIMEVLLKYTLFDFSQKAEVSEAGDELDAVAIGLNTLAEELVASHEAEHKQLENFKEANHFLDTILDNIPNVVFVKDVKELKYLRINKAGEKLMNLSNEALIGKTNFDLFPKAQAEELTAKDREALKNEGITDIPEELVETLTGFRWLHTKKMAIVENGKPVYLLGISEDITERKKTEQALKDSEKRLRLLIEGVKDYAIFMIDPNGNILNWNTGAETIKGYKAEEVIGKNISIFYPKEDVEKGKPRKNLEMAKLNGRFEDEDWRVKKDGTKFWADVIFTALYNEKNELTGYSKITRDVTEKKMAEEKVK
ncbi:MAG: Sensory box histidine kinase/response regulator, partial [Bacteroidetes bacterium]|nr:Sensory box histidine kinase/response regulator [Bacteroidota bacterium]